jgi:OmpA-OmpF porin, OOP family
MRIQQRAASRVTRSGFAPLRLTTLQIAALLLASLAPAVARAQGGQGTPGAVPLPPMMVYAEGQKAKFSGVIIAREGDDIKVREGERAVHIVTVNQDTEIKTPSGFMKWDRVKRDPSTLIPGLMLKVKGHGAGNGKLIAEEIHYSATSLRTAQQINVGQEVLSGRVSANADSIAIAKRRALDSLARLERRTNDSLARVATRISNLDDFDVKTTAVVNFETNSAVLSGEARKTLDGIVAKATPLKGFMLEVTGYADTTGTDSRNRDLSQRRAEAVIAYFTEVHQVPIRRLLNPTGHGSEKAIASNATPDGRAMNRRAQVRVLVNRALGDAPRR